MAAFAANEPVVQLLDVLIAPHDPTGPLNVIQHPTLSNLNPCISRLRSRSHRSLAERCRHTTTTHRRRRRAAETTQQLTLGVGSLSLLQWMLLGTRRSHLRFEIRFRLRGRTSKSV